MGIYFLGYSADNVTDGETDNGEFNTSPFSQGQGTKKLALQGLSPLVKVLIWGFAF